jgi:hypothetical protein
MKNSIGDWVAALFLVAVVYMLAKPGSVASSAISSFTTALSALMAAATGSSSSTTGKASQ